MTGASPLRSRTWCLFRTDRIGDLILTLPLVEAIRRQAPHDRIILAVRPYTAPLARLCPGVDAVLEVPDRDLSWKEIPSWVRRLRREKIDTAVFAFPRPGLALAAALARIPRRIGTARRWYCALFTHRHPDRRHESRWSEAVYNLRLLDLVGIGSPASFSPPLRIPDHLREDARQVLRTISLDPDRPYMVIHPGSGGSARDLSPERLGHMAAVLHRRHPDLQVLITGTESEQEVMLAAQSAAGVEARVLSHTQPLEVLAGILSGARLCLANSTGPLHLASACGTPVLGFYPFRPVCHPRRWGPLFGSFATLVPPPDPSCPSCAEGICERHDRMERISEDDALSVAEALLTGTISSSRGSNA